MYPEVNENTVLRIIYRIKEEIQLYNKFEGVENEGK